MNYLLHLAAWVLLQSSWQTLGVALLLPMSMRLLGGAPSEQRHRCAVLHLLTAVSAIVLTAVVSQVNIAAGACAAPMDEGHSAWFSGLRDDSQPFLAALVSIWLAGIVIAQLLLVVRLARVARLVRMATPAPPEIAAIVEDLSRRIGLARWPRVCCGDVQSPLVAGRRGSVVVVPYGFAEVHSAREVRALLAHELAHVVRRDYSGNVLHLLLASVLWWHPGVWFIYARIRHERECSCDELAVEITGSCAGLANGLVRLAALPAGADAVLVGASSRELVNRISRIAELRKREASRLAPWVSACAVALFMGAVAGASAAAARVDPLTRAFAASPLSPRTVFTIHAQDPAGSFLVRMLRGRVLGVVVGDEPIPAGRVSQRGGTVTVTSRAGGELLRLEVDPRGGFRWTPRRRGASS